MIPSAPLWALAGRRAATVFRGCRGTAALLSVCILTFPGVGLLVADARGQQIAVEAAIENLLAQTPLVIDGQEIDAAAIRDAYARHGFRPMWLAGNRERMDAALAAMAAAADEGLDPADYLGPAIVPPLDSTDPARLAALDILVSDALQRYIGDVLAGRTSPRKVDPELFVQPKAVDASAILLAAASAPDIRAFLQRQAPKNPYYRRLRRALAVYRRIAAAGGWASVPEGPLLREGDISPRVGPIRARLAATGDLGANPDPAPRIGPLLASAIAAFQRRHGLAPDGVVGPRTLAAMNVPVEARVRQIVINMERWRWMPDEPGDRYVLVNLAGFALEVVDNGWVVLDMRVIVGRPYRRSPVFSDRIRYIELNPTWTVPPTILRKDIIPKFRKNPEAIAADGFRIYSGWGEEAAEIEPASIDWDSVGSAALGFRIVQMPGPANALGRMKFMFPNRFDVYLHDTPTRELFGHEVRSFSSGCIRVAEPLDLAVYLLSGSEWTRERLQSAVDGGMRRAITLPTPIPVHLSYATVWIGEGGDIHFRDDIYGRDQVLDRALPPTVPAGAGTAAPADAAR